MAGYLPEDVASAAASAQSNDGAVAHAEVLRDLEDEDSIRVALAVESDTGVYRNPGRPFVQARSESHPTNISGTQFSSSRICSSRSVGVSGLHVTYGRGQHGWSGSGIVGRIHFSGH